MPSAVTSTGLTPPKNNGAKEKKYKDPLNNWVVKSLSYTNEIGAGINEIAPKLTFALWIPTFMYLGADIYDKYKNDQNEYNPSGKRGVKRAITQGLSSFILPAGAIILGQKVTSPVGKLISDKLSINAKDTVFRHTKDVIDQTIGKTFDNKDEFKQFIRTSLENKVRALENSKQTDNIFKKVYRYMTGYFAASDADRKKLFAFADKNADNIFEIKEALENGTKDSKIPKRIYKKYTSTVPAMQKLYGNDFTHHALKTALKEYQNTLIVRNKLFKTIGGLVSLVFLISPINYFVDKILMPKYIVPGMDLIGEKLRESNHLRLHVKRFDDYHVITKSHSSAREKNLQQALQSEAQKIPENQNLRPDSKPRQTPEAESQQSQNPRLNKNLPANQEHKDRQQI